jgi:hypothetical protein
VPAVPVTFCTTPPGVACTVTCTVGEAIQLGMRRTSAAVPLATSSDTSPPAGNVVFWTTLTAPAVYLQHGRKKSSIISTMYHTQN